jgi:dTDP-4-dehydrorhamnose 3,5-epimerase
MTFNYENTEIEGVLLRRPKVNADHRGWLLEMWRVEDVANPHLPKMAYISRTYVGESRGPHEHSQQTDFFCFTGITKWVVYLRDNRKDSPTFGLMMVLEIDTDPFVIVVPPGVAHAYLNAGPGLGIVVNLPSELYGGLNYELGVDEIRHEDDPESIFVKEFQAVKEQHK